MEALRTVARGVFPAQLARRGLPAALVTHVQNTHPTVPVTVQPWWSGRRLEARLKSTLYFATVHLLDQLTTVHSVELTTDEDGRLARVLVVSPGPPAGPASQFRVLTDRLAVFDGCMRLSQAAHGELTYQLELPGAARELSEQILPGGAQAVGAE